MDAPSLEQLLVFRQRGRTARNLVFTEQRWTNADLSGLRADGLELREVAVVDSDLRGVHWSGCRLVDVRFESVDAHKSAWRMSTLDGLRATGARFIEAKLEDMSARGAVLDRAVLTGASLTESDFGRCSLREADLRQVDATGVDLRGADLTGADLTGARLVEVDLRGADLSGARYDIDALADADLRGAIMHDADRPRRPSASPEPVLSPNVERLAGALAPVVGELLRRGEAAGAPETHRARWQKDIEKEGWTGIDIDQTHPAIAKVVAAMAGVDMRTLADALKSDDPSDAVQSMVRRLGEDFELGPDATAEDLVGAMVRQLGSTSDR
ncbi:MAG: pentapeptide repeat-containing protein [Myxococcota bacterium]